MPMGGVAFERGFPYNPHKPVAYATTIQECLPPVMRINQQAL